MFGGRYLRQRTALGSESTALQTETTLGLPTGQKRRICGKNVINLLIFGFFLTFLAINLQADLWRILGISLVFFTFFFFSKSKTLQTFLFVIFPHFFVGNLQADLWRILGISLVFLTLFLGSKSKSLQTGFLLLLVFPHSLADLQPEFFVVVGFPTLFGRFTARAVANSRYFIGFLRLKIQRMQNAPPYREKKKKKNRQTEAKSHAIVTTR